MTEFRRVQVVPFVDRFFVFEVDVAYPVSLSGRVGLIVPDGP